VENQKSISPNIFDFLDYRKYLAAFFEHKKAVNPRFSYRVFARIIGLGSHSLIKMVIDGKRKLASHSVRAVARACELDREATKYFQTLVQWNHAESTQEKDLFWKDLIRQKMNLNAHNLSNPQLQVLSDWKSAVILELVREPNFEPTADWISRKLRIDVTLEDLKRILDNLKRVSLVEESSRGWRALPEQIVKGGDVPNEMIQMYHHTAGMAALQSIGSVPVHEREFSGLTVHMTEEQLKRLKEAIRSFQSEVQSQQTDFSKAKLYQLNIQLFPLTKNNQ
jgi:uncharacterized protein (TIGR02147 family)